MRDDDNIPPVFLATRPGASPRTSAADRDRMSRSYSCLARKPPEEPQFGTLSTDDISKIRGYKPVRGHARQYSIPEYHGAGAIAASVASSQASDNRFSQVDLFHEGQAALAESSDDELEAKGADWLLRRIGGETENDAVDLQLDRNLLHSTEDPEDVETLDEDEREWCFDFSHLEAGFLESHTTYTTSSALAFEGPTWPHSSRHQDKYHDLAEPQCTFYSPSTGVVRAKRFQDFAGEDGRWLRDQATAGNFWIDIHHPTPEETELISKVFSIHPLTMQDILSGDYQTEKCDAYSDYICMAVRTVDLFEDSPNYLGTTMIWILVFPRCILSFHMDPLPQIPVTVQRLSRIQEKSQGHTYFHTAWVCYLLVAEILDALDVLIHDVEHEADEIEDLVLYGWEDDEEAERGNEVLQRMHAARKRNTMLLRLMIDKARVLKGAGKKGAKTSSRDLWGSELCLYFDSLLDRAVADIQRLRHYDEMLTRSHSEYLEEISLCLNAASKRAGELARKMTAVVTLLVPLGAITGMLGINVLVPGAPPEDPDDEEADLTSFFIASFTMIGLFVGGYIWAKESVNVLLKPLFDDSATDELTHYSELSATFEAQTGIRINVDLEPPASADATDYFSVINPLVLSANQAYDIVAIDTPWINQFPHCFYDILQDQPGSPQTASDLRQRTLDEDPSAVLNNAVHSSVLAVPMWADYSVVYARQDLLTKYNLTLPAGYTDMKTACGIVLAGEAPTHRSLQCFVGGLNGADIVELFAEWFYTDSTTVLLKYPQQATFDTPSTRALLTSYQSWIKNSSFIADRALQYDGGSALAAWLSGESLFFRGKASAMQKTTKAFAAAAKGWTFSIVSGNNPAAVSPMVSVQGGYHLAMTRAGYQNDTKVALALLYLTGPDVQKARALKFGALPTLTAVSQDAATCAAVNCSLLGNLVPFSLPAAAAAPFWVDAVSAMAPYFTGIINNTYDPGTGLSLATVAVAAAFVTAQQAASNGKSMTVVILLSVLVPLAVVSLLLAGALCWWRRKSKVQKKIVEGQEEQAVGVPASGADAVPSMAERKGVMNLSVRPARRPDATNAAELRSAVGTNAKDSSTSAATGDAALAATAGGAAGAAAAGAAASAGASGADRGDLRGNSYDPPGMIGANRSLRSRTSSSDHAAITQRFTVIHAYKPAVGDELELRPGDVVSVRLAYDDGYAFGHNEMTSTAGVFPLACLLPVGMEVGLPSRLESGAVNSKAMQAQGPYENVDSLEMLLLSGRITEATYLSLRRDQEEELRTQRQITALRERLTGVLEEGERRKLQNRLDELELGI
ncbi:CorA metal ion transporter [Thoreauomyces humboldtii]|nr:CorA metal ion transporter [Thoreauomyces humboldtii]